MTTLTPIPLTLRERGECKHIRTIRPLKTDNCSMDFTLYKAMTFDCYGTLVDWESAILSGLKPVLTRRNVSLTDEEILERYGRYEQKAESSAYLPYREVLALVVRHFGREFGFEPAAEEASVLADTFDDWRPFSDTVAALQELKKRFRLAILSNVDDDLFAITAKHLQVPFDEVITAQQVGSYKPSHRNFETAIRRIGLPREAILHVGQSIYHDIVPARALGIAVVWVNRRQGKPGHGATVPAAARPDLEVPDLRTLASLTSGARA